MSKQRTFLFVALALMVWSVIATLTSVYYYEQYIETRRTFEEFKSIVIGVNVLMDYGNGTQDWHNKTVIAGSTAFDALLAVTTNVGYTTYPYGVYVTSINGVKNEGTFTSGHAWMWYQWNATTSKWVDLQKAADAYILRSNDSIAWRYESYSF